MSYWYTSLSRPNWVLRIDVIRTKMESTKWGGRRKWDRPNARDEIGNYEIGCEQFDGARFQLFWWLEIAQNFLKSATARHIVKCLSTNL